MTGIDEVERARLENAITRLENQLLFRGESLGTVASALVRALHESSSVIQQLKKDPRVKRRSSPVPPSQSPFWESRAVRQIVQQFIVIGPLICELWLSLKTFFDALKTQCPEVVFYSSFYSERHAVRLVLRRMFSIQVAGKRVEQMHNKSFCSTI